MKCLFLVMLVLSCFWTSLKSQQATNSIFMNTDRPTRSYNPRTLAKNRFLLETGFEVNDHPKFKLTSYNTSILRYGLTHGIELRLRLGLTDIEDKRTDIKGKKDKSTGVELLPVAIGFKAKLFESKKWRTNVAFIGQVGMNKGLPGEKNFLGGVSIGGPGGSRIQISGWTEIQRNTKIGTAFEGTLAVMHRITNFLFFGYNYGAVYFDFDPAGGTIEGNINGGYRGFFSSYLNLAVSKKLSLFSEYYITGSWFGLVQILEGLRFYPNPKIQLDIFGGTKLDDYSSELMFGFGAGFLFNSNR